jgi:hypothetical protein
MGLGTGDEGKDFWLSFRLGFRQTIYTTAGFPFPSFFHEFDPLETLEDIPFNHDFARSTKAFVL